MNLLLSLQDQSLYSIVNKLMAALQELFPGLQM